MGQNTWTDKRQYLRKLTLRKVWNAGLLYFGYHWSKLRRKPLQWGLPTSISVEPTTACNLGCPECPSGLRQFSRPTGNLKSDFFRGMIDEMAGHLSYLTFYFQGEPFINPQFLEMVSYAGQKGIYTATSTNAHFLHDQAARKTVESGLDRLIISIDGTTQEVYEQYRINGKLEKVIDGTKNIIKWKKELQSSTPHVIFQFLVVRPNEHQIDEVHQLAEELGVDEVRLKTAQVYEYVDGNPLIPSDERYARYRQKPDGTWGIKNKMVNQCWRMWQGCVVTWDGLVVPCCFDKDAHHRLGDLKNTKMKEVWQSEPYRDFRSAILKSRSEIDICQNCTEGTKVWA